jgi:hypothetical protein
MGSIKRNLANNITTGGAFDATDLSGTIPSTNVADASLTNLTTFNPALGDTIESVASDPVSATEGQFWYNSTSGVLKGLVQIKAWSAGGNMTTARRYLAGAGTQTAGLGFGGFTVPPAAAGTTTATEEYSGYTWSAGGNLNTARRGIAGAGTQTAGLGFGGYTGVQRNETEKYNGSTWTVSGTLGTARSYLAGCGTQTAGLAFGGNSSSTATESFNGTTWTAGGSLNTGRTQIAGCGTQTAALAFGGNPVRVNTEKYNGTTWTTSGNLNTGRESPAGAGTQTAGLGFGGYAGAPTPASTATEEFDGTIWATSTAMATGRRALGGAGTRSAALAFGGTTGTNTAATEEYFSDIANYSPASFDVWASGGNMNTARDLLNGCGTALSNTLVFGGDNGPSRVAATESYNGSAWTTVSSLNTNRSALGSATQGTSSAALGFAGYPSTNANEEYNGSTWTSVSSYGNSGYGVGGAGTQTAALGVGGTASQTSTFEYNGSTWSPGGTYPSGLYYGGVTGTQTAAIATSGGGGAGATAAKEYDGSTWTATGNYPNPAASRVSAFGIQTISVFHDNNAAYSTNVNTYNGSVFASAPSMATAKGGWTGRGGSGSEGLFSGDTHPRTGATEEWTTGSPASPTGAAASTITTS